MEKLIESVKIAVRMAELDESEDKWERLEQRLAHMVKVFCLYREERIEKEVENRLQATDSLEKLFRQITNIEGDFDLRILKDEDCFAGWQASIQLFGDVCGECETPKPRYTTWQARNKSPRKALEKLIAETENQTDL